MKCLEWIWGQAECKLQGFKKESKAEWSRKQPKHRDIIDEATEVPLGGSWGDQFHLVTGKKSEPLRAVEEDWACLSHG